MAGGWWLVGVEWWVVSGEWWVVGSVVGGGQNVIKKFYCDKRQRFSL